MFLPLFPVCTEVGIRFVGSADCLKAGIDRCGDELHVQLPRASQPSLLLDNSHPHPLLVITLTNGAMELPDHTKLIGP
jgi:hypothetical protein